ncbi:PAS domain-containing protein [Sphingomonas sp. MAH-20]|uniref:PAS domain-containing protein n=1 Tax=Sphingomonas horti TaxID=2682842 RepID=A0A6I4IXT9_9SPHN|nr:MULTISPECIES: PAS domain-containing protein [Sphingomonas]MBA2921022.1 PAS domain-containing protein [Sphingomonas sp. CGMCC 1.13658]MVO77010.1 PAS domain-containing protein [Sphingomonas horti]
MSATESQPPFSIDKTPLATVITNPRLSDNPIVSVNDAFCSLTGYSPDEVLGRNCRFLCGQGTEPAVRRILREAVAEARHVLAEVTNYRKDGSAFLNAVMIAPLLDSAGAVAWFVGSQMDVSDARAGMSARKRAAGSLVARLTVRQREVLEFMVAGYRNKQIAGFLEISEKTVKMHRKGLLTNLGALTSADAIRLAVEAGVEPRRSGPEDARG